MVIPAPHGDAGRVPRQQKSPRGGFSATLFLELGDRKRFRPSYSLSDLSRPRAMRADKTIRQHHADVKRFSSAGMFAALAA